MTYRPLNLRAEEVRAIRDGRKTMLRRIVKLSDPTQTYAAFAEDGWPMTEDDRGYWSRDPCPFGTVGDRLWCRETWAENYSGIHGAQIHYRADLPDDRGAALTANHAFGLMEWRSPVTMPRWASRLTLEIVGVRVERLNSISEADAIADGGWQYSDCPIHKNPIESFARHWNQINGPGSWDENPFVWVLSFLRVSE